MLDVQVIWDLEDDPAGNVQHLAANGVTVEEYLEVFAGNYDQATISRSSSRPITFGWTSSGKHIAVVWHEVQHQGTLIIRPITAFEAPPQRKN